MNEYFITYTVTEHWPDTGPTEKTVRQIVNAYTAKEAVDATLNYDDTLMDIRKL